jgi:membrane protein DedA with SNARE-associated domain
VLPLEEIFNWLTSLPPVALYLAAFSLAFIENIFPPFPSDLFIGVCAFAAAPGEASLALTYACVLGGNVAGAASVYAIARRYGAEGLRKRLEARGWLKEEARLERLYIRYGIPGMFAGRLVPGVRGVVPMLAGALRIKWTGTLAAVVVAAAIWYGVLVGLAYRVGENWEEYAAEIAALGKWGTYIGLGIITVGAVVAFIVLRRKRRAE